MRKERGACTASGFSSTPARYSGRWGRLPNVLRRGPHADSAAEKAGGRAACLLDLVGDRFRQTHGSASVRLPYRIERPRLAFVGGEELRSAILGGEGFPHQR